MAQTSEPRPFRIFGWPASRDGKRYKGKLNRIGSRSKKRCCGCAGCDGVKACGWEDSPCLKHRTKS